MLIGNRLQLQLKEKRYISPRSLELTYSSMEPLRYIPGQFFSLNFTTEKGEFTRSYSIANCDFDIQTNRSLTFVITLVEHGKASDYFKNAMIGSEISASGPFGNLILPRQDPQRYILIATGAGITPYRSMLNELKKRLALNEQLEIKLIHGVRDPDELLYRDEFCALQAEQPNFDYTACYSRASDGLKAFERAGYVTSEFERLKPVEGEDMVYLCGHPLMIDQSVDYFEALNFSVANLKREKYLFSTI